MSDAPPPDTTPSRAVAVHYHSVEELPTVVASGAGDIARRIVEIAERHDIPIMQDGSLSQLLSKVNVGANISEESFGLVAEIICFLYEADKAWRDAHPDLKPVLG